MILKGDLGMTADTMTLTRSPGEVALGYPTGLTPASAPLTADGQLESWRGVLDAARRTAGRSREAQTWVDLRVALRIYARDRGDDPSNMNLMIHLSNQAVRLAEQS